MDQALSQQQRVVSVRTLITSYGLRKLGGRPHCGNHGWEQSLTWPGSPDQTAFIILAECDIAKSASSTARSRWHPTPKRKTVRAPTAQNRRRNGNDVN